MQEAPSLAPQRQRIEKKRREGGKDRGREGGREGGNEMLQF
jgi:hypothetical protein